MSDGFNLKYSDGTRIPKCTPSMVEVMKPREDWWNGYRLNVGLVINDNTFRGLYKDWIESWIEFIGEEYEKELVKEPKKIFSSKAKAEDCNEFLEEFIDVIMDELPSCPYDAICEQVDKRLSTVAIGIRLRVKIICMILTALPEEAFAEGERWTEPLLAKDKEADFIKVSNGMKFLLKLEKGEENLCPKTLYNENSYPCSIGIKYESEEYVLLLPAKSSLRVVFGNKTCKYLVSIKGNISFNRSEDRNAIIQKIEPKQSSLEMFVNMRGGKWRSLDTKGYFMDATVNGKGGATLLIREGLYDTSWDNITELSKLPMRLYGAGQFYARHYADGSLESNVCGRDGTSFQNVIAVVENGESSLLIRDKFGAWVCGNGGTEEITEEEFVKCMLDRFLQDGVCEQTSSELMTLAITEDGKVIVK